MQRDSIKDNLAEFVVGRRSTGRIVSEHYTLQAAREKLAHMTDSTGYDCFSREQWEKETATPYEENAYLLRHAIEAFDGIDEKEAQKVVNANLGMRGRLEGLKDQIDKILERM